MLSAKQLMEIIQKLAGKGNLVQLILIATTGITPQNKTHFIVVKQRINPCETYNYHPNNFRAMNTMSTCQCIWTFNI